jgi:hypothetical protein
MDDVVTITFTRDELATMDYVLSQKDFEDIPECIQLGDVIKRAIWDANTEYRDE